MIEKEIFYEKSVNNITLGHSAEERLNYQAKTDEQGGCRKDVELYIKLHIANHRPG